MAVFERWTKEEMKNFILIFLLPIILCFNLEARSLSWFTPEWLADQSNSIGVYKVKGFTTCAVYGSQVDLSLQLKIKGEPPKATDERIYIYDAGSNNIECSVDDQVLVCFGARAPGINFLLSLRAIHKRTSNRVFSVSGNPILSGVEALGFINKRLVDPKDKWDGDHKELLVCAPESSVAYKCFRGRSGCYLFVPKDLQTDEMVTYYKQREKFLDNLNNQETQ